jgi:hypothetical protein
MNSSFHLFVRIFAMSTLLSSPMTQLTFSWAEPEAVAAPTVSVSPARVSLGIEVPAAKPSMAKIENALPSSVYTHGASGVTSAERRCKPEHISDLLLVVLDRYGISPDEFLAGLQ